MSNHPPIPVDTDAFLADTTALGPTAVGAYWLIIMAIWRSKDGWIAGDDRSLSRVVRLTMDKWRRLSPAVRPFLTEKDGRVSQKRTMRERNKLAALPGIPARNPGSDPKPLENLDPPPKPAPAGKSDSLFSSLPSDSKTPRKEVRKERVVGTRLPDDWQVPDAERLYAKTVLRLTDEDVERALEQMRRWTKKEAHRKVTLKSDWPATFRNWLDKYAVEQKPHGGNGHGRRSGSASDAAERLVEGLRSGALSIPPEPRRPSDLLRGAGQAAPGLLPPK